MNLRKIALIATLLASPIFAEANTVETVFWENTILSAPLKASILKALQEHCPGGIVEDGLKEDLTMIRTIEKNENRSIRNLTTTLSSAYSVGKRKNLTQSIEVESTEIYDEKGTLIEHKVVAFGAICPPIEAGAAANQ